MFERLKHMLIKEFIQVFRDPRMRFVIFVIPCVQVMVIGYAVSSDVKHIQTAVYDLDNTDLSRELVARFVSSGYFDVVARVGSEAELKKLIDRGEVTAALQMNRGFSEEIRGDRVAQLQVIVDGTDSNTAAVVGRYASEIARDFAQQLFVQQITRRFGGVRQPGLPELEYYTWFNENLETRDFYVPGVIVVVVTLATLLLTSMAVVREKEIGTIEQILVTPIRPIEFILGKTVPFGIIGMADVVIVMLLGKYWFDVPMRGSVGTLLFASALYIATALGVGLLISTISQTQQQAMITTFFFFFPAMLLSGFAFPIANMPIAVQWLTTLNPLAYFLVIVRGIFLKGVGFAVLWPQMLALAVMAVSVLWFVSRRFHKTL